MINKIFLDLDDTLNDYMGYALEKLGCEGPYDPAFGNDFHRAVNELHPTRDFTKWEVWDALDSLDMGKDVPKSNEFELLVHWSKDIVGLENVFILTTMVAPELITFKLSWMRNHLPGWLQDQYILTTRKRACASREALLIDDCEQNVDEFQAAGGKAILVPRPWNRLHRMRTNNITLLYLMNELGVYRSPYTPPELIDEELALAQEIVKEEDA